MILFVSFFLIINEFEKSKIKFDVVAFLQRFRRLKKGNVTSCWSGTALDEGLGLDRPRRQNKYECWDIFQTKLLKTKRNKWNIPGIRHLSIVPILIQIRSIYKVIKTYALINDFAAWLVLVLISPEMPFHGSIWLVKKKKNGYQTWIQGWLSKMIPESNMTLVVNWLEQTGKKSEESGQKRQSLTSGY